MIDSLQSSQLSAPRQPPNSLEAEQALLGAVMLSERVYDRIGDQVIEDHFYRETHRLIWKAIRDLADAGRPFDPVTVTERLQHWKVAERVDGGAYLTQLANEVPTTHAGAVHGWAEILADKHLRRHLVQAGTEIADEAFNGDDPLAFATSAIGQMDLPGADALIDMKQAARVFLDRMSELADPSTPLVRTGLAEIDRQIGGLHPGDLMIAAGRPGMGKSTYGMQIGWNVAKTGLPVQVFQLEMSVFQLIKRRIAAAGVANDRMRSPNELSEDEWKSIRGALVNLRDLPVYIDETPALTIREIQLRARRARRRHGIGLIIIDYLQLVRPSRSRNSREQEVAEVSSGLKALAKELGVPVIALAQLNRAVETRANKRPMMADLRESGQIEQDADVIQFLYFNGKYEKGDHSGILEVITDKFRDGATGAALVGYRPGRFAMVNADYDTMSEYRDRFLSDSKPGGGAGEGFEL